MSNILREQISMKLYENRVKEGASQAKMALNCGVSAREYSDWESGKRTMQLDSFLRFAIKYDIDINVFIKALINKGYTKD